MKLWVANEWLYRYSICYALLFFFFVFFPFVLSFNPLLLVVFDLYFLFCFSPNWFIYIYIYVCMYVFPPLVTERYIVIKCWMFIWELYILPWYPLIEKEEVSIIVVVKIFLIMRVVIVSKKKKKKKWVLQ